MHRAILLALVWVGGTAGVAGEVKLTVSEPAGVARAAWPVTSGVPLQDGALADAEQVQLLSVDGQSVPLQTAVLARWPSGSIRWMLVDFQADLAPHATQTWTLKYGSGIQRSTVANPLHVSSSDDVVLLNTGPLKLELSSARFRLLDAAWLDANGDGQFTDDERITATDGAGIVLTTPDGKRASAELASGSAVVEESGPLRACIRFEGTHAGEQGHRFRYIVRLHAFRGQPFVKLHYTFVNDCQDALMTQVDTLELRFTAAESTGLNYWLDGSNGAGGRLFQIDENQYTLNGIAAGTRGKGWAALAGPRGGLAVGMREFWQNWPKGLAAGSGQLRVGICPDFAKGQYDGHTLPEENKLYYYLRDGVYTFKVGVARTHELWANFFPTATRGEQLDAFFRAAEEPLLATCEPHYASSTLALGAFPPADARRFGGYDAWLDRALDAHLRRRDRVREFGMLNYGDWFGERDVNWGNLEYDLAHGLFLQYLRTGDRRFFQRAEQAARHHIDVDVVHAVNPHLKNPFGRVPKVGDIWLHCCNHTGGYYNTDRILIEPEYQMGHSTNYGHVWVGGDLEYYYLTGDRRALDVSRQIADTMAANCPTAYSTHLRSVGWPLLLLLNAYEATGDTSYLRAAEKEWAVLRQKIDWQRGWVVRLAADHCRHPVGSTRKERETTYADQRCHGNVPFMEGLTLCGLARYHRVTQDPDVLRALTVGIEQMIRECWQEDVKTFRYTACTLSNKAPYELFFLSAEAMAYEAHLTGNPEHRRILREGLIAAIQHADDSGFGKNLAQTIHFTPYGLQALK